MRDHRLPIWNGEWGPVYASSSEYDGQKTNQVCLEVVKQQLQNYNRIECGRSL